jgi:hypothetical protein
MEVAFYAAKRGRFLSNFERFDLTPDFAQNY